MNRKAIRTEFGPVEVAGSFVANGVQHPPAVLQRWSAAELAEIGVEDIHEQTYVPAGSRVVGRHLEVVADIIVEVLDLEPMPLEELKDQLQDRQRAKRWAVEQGGMLFGGQLINTDDKGQAKIAGAVALFDKDPTLTEISWEAQPNLWVVIDKPTADALGVAAGRHVQACFKRSSDLCAAIIAAETVEDLSAIDIEGGWPATAA